MPALGAVCFDLDGTLCVSAQDTDQLLVRAFDDAGVDPLFDVDGLWEIDTSTLPTAVEPRDGALDAPAERTLFVGNSLGADVAGAHATGMQSAWAPMDEPRPDPDPEPTYVLDSLAGLPELL